MDLDDTGVSELEVPDGGEVLNASVPALAEAWVREKVGHQHLMPLHLHHITPTRRMPPMC